MNTVITGRNMLHIDKDTGEKICETSGVVKIQDDTLTDKEKKKKEYEETHCMNFGKGMDFVKMYTTVVWKLAQKLSPREFSIAIALCKYVDYEKYSLRNGYGKGRHDVDLHELSEDLDIEYSSLCKIFRKLIAKGIVGEFKVGDMNEKITKKYYVNPYIYSNGSHPENEVLNNFSKTGWESFINS